MKRSLSHLGFVMWNVRLCISSGRKLTRPRSSFFFSFISPFWQPTAHQRTEQWLYGGGSTMFFDGNEAASSIVRPYTLLG